MAESAPPQPVNPGTVLQTLLAFKRTSMLRTALELKLYDALADGPRDAAHIAEFVGAPQRSVRVLLGAMTSAGLLEGDGEKYALPEGAGKFLVSTSPGYLGGAEKVASSYAEWDALRELTAVVRNGGTLLADDANSPGFAYWKDFAANGTFATRPGAALVADALRPFATDREPLRLLDVGCGHALFALTFAKAYPRAQVFGIDWPEVLDHARHNATAMGLTDRSEFLAGDVFTAPLGGPYDVVVVANFLPQFSAAQGVELLRRLRGVLAPDGRVVLAGFTVGDQPPASEFGAWMLNLLMLAWTEGGEIQDLATYQRMLDEAGFTGTEVHKVANLPVRVLVARPVPD
jgi:cyclopropane fatty-acyl-phospholipid synthase-like methyltransferase